MSSSTGSPMARMILCRAQGEHRQEEECLLLPRTLNFEQAKDQIRDFWKLPPVEVSIPALPIAPSLPPPSPATVWSIINSQEYQHRESRSGRSATQQRLTSQEGAPIQLLYVEGNTIVRLTPQAWDILKGDPAFRLIYWRDDPAEPRNAPKPTRAV
ncbi:hypothetical protein FRC14_002091 [Serendipita sp. 396]|nr:hypothetical protein FRC14_002091 [Serendipita sp. 396]KAG8782863.1 hypothetical protein FRC15_006157 [Serendipita sp. 397]KAG8798868.1 hypothetical protein FRC16_006384 [Serendipita sp. 398]KAG8867159.1 hypothetical protein FRC20_006559 [Serendipita sp. 405]